MSSVSRVAAGEAADHGKSRLPKRVRWRPRWSFTHLIMMVAGLLAFVAVIAVLRDREAVVELPIVVSDIGAGEVIGIENVSLVTTRGPSADLTAAAVTAEEFGSATRAGLVAARDIRAVSLLSAVDLTEPGGVGSVRTMSIPIAGTDGVGRSLGRGDVVDIVAVVDGVAAFVATDVDVVGVTPNTQPATGSLAVNIAVDASTSLRLAWVLSRTEVRFVRAAGAPPADPAATYPEQLAGLDGD